MQRLLALRRASRALTVGDYRSFDAGSDAIFAYLCEAGTERLCVVLNFGPDAEMLELAVLGAAGEILCSTGMERAGSIDLGALTVAGGEGLLIRL